ncbi:TetR/AcrR family transcriptional regulator [Nocardioides sp. R-C-SC26]|uniref:TetR/AcrR family transcriptional regulator n=1 Tax=Nocardioides sp. R-C-SC26 TaxID=2870414 RepID=UPI001E486B10|nr:TetR/AcrR family transcriptional regulator [Nocardioides sp. R-C-SC26]
MKVGRPSGVRGRRGEGRERVLNAAMELIGERGFASTSLQLIADRVGVTKAAVYHQFHAKDEIALTLLEPLLEAWQGLIESVEQHEAGLPRRRAAARGIVDVAVAQRRVISALIGDPDLVRVAETHPEWCGLRARIDDALAGPEPTSTQLLEAALVLHGVSRAVGDPRLSGLDAGELRAALRAIVERLL